MLAGDWQKPCWPWANQRLNVLAGAGQGVQLYWELKPGHFSASNCNQSLKRAIERWADGCQYL